jgi:AcrR family transcriptional regulator
MTNTTIQKNKYRSTVREEAEALTHQRILTAARSLYIEHWIDQITLEQVASRANVSVQTILRHFGNMQGLWVAVGRMINDSSIQQREEAPVGNIPGAVKNLVDHYETNSATGLRTLALEGRYPQLDAMLCEGRQYHQAWVERVFLPYLKRCSTNDGQRVKAQLAAICDMYMWKLLRVDGGLSREAAESALKDMLTAVLNQNQLFLIGDQPNERE